MTKTQLEDSPALVVRFTAYVIAVFYIYALLVIADYGLGRYKPAIKEMDHTRHVRADIDMILKARDSGFTSLIYPALFDADKKFRDIAERYKVAPLAPQPNQKLYYCNEGYGQVRYVSDRFGFRNNNKIWDQNDIDVILIGDSFTQGACVQEEDSISGVLSKQIKAINLGTGGNGPIHYAAIAKTFIPIMPVKNVAIIFYPNDNLDESQSLYKKYYFEDNIEYFNRNTQTKKPVSISANLINLYKDAQIIAEEAVKHNLKNSIANASIKVVEEMHGEEDKMTLLRASLKMKNMHRLAGWMKRNFSAFALQLPYSSKLAIDTLDLECKKYKCNPIIVYIPNSVYWRPNPDTKKYLAAIKKYTATRKLSFIDTSSDIESLGLSAYSPQGPHLSPVGYKLVAELILAKLVR